MIWNPSNRNASIQYHNGWPICTKVPLISFFFPFAFFVPFFGMCKWHKEKWQFQFGLSKWWPIDNHAAGSGFNPLNQW